MNPFDLAQSAVENDRSLHDVSPVYAELSVMAEEARDNPNARIAAGVPDRLDGIEIARQLEVQAESVRLHALAERLAEHALSEITRESIGFSDAARFSHLLDLANKSHSDIAVAMAEKMLRANTSDASSPMQWSNLIITKASIGDAAGAYAIAIEELGRVPEAAICWQVLARHGFYEEAIEQVQKTIDELPDGGADQLDSLHSRLAMMHLDHGDVSQAKVVAGDIVDHKKKFFTRVDIAEHTRDQADYREVVEMATDPTFTTVTSDVPLTLAAQFRDIETIDAILDQPTVSPQDKMMFARGMGKAYSEWPSNEMKQRLLNIVDDLAMGKADNAADYNALLASTCRVLASQGELANARELLKNINIPYSRIAALASIVEVEHNVSDINSMKNSIGSPFMKKNERLDALKLMLEAVPTPEMLEFVKVKIPGNFPDHASNSRNLASAIAAVGDYDYAESIARQIYTVSTRTRIFIDLAGISREQAEEYDQAHGLELPA